MGNRLSEIRRSNEKIQAQQVSAFNGKGLEWRAWKKRIRAAIGTAGLLKLLDSKYEVDHHLGDNETIFHRLEVATAEGTASHLVDKHEKTDRHGAWDKLIR